MENGQQILKKKTSSIPAAKRNKKGIIVTKPNDLKKLYIDEVKMRLRSRHFHSQMSAWKIQQEKIFFHRLNQAKLKKSPLWSMTQISEVLKEL